MSACTRIGLLASLLLALVPQPFALAEGGKPLSTLVQWAAHQKLLSGFHVVPEDHPDSSVLYGCRFGGYETAVRAFLRQGRLVKEQIEVELPGDRSDDVALGIIESFVGEFLDNRGTKRSLWIALSSLRQLLAQSGLKEDSGYYFGYLLSLRLDSAPENSNALMSQEQRTWGTLFWRGEVALPPSLWPQAPHRKPETRKPSTISP